MKKFFLIATVAVMFLSYFLVSSSVNAGSSGASGVMICYKKKENSVSGRFHYTCPPIVTQKCRGPVSGEPGEEVACATSGASGAM